VRILLGHSFYRLTGGEDRYVRQVVELLGRDHDVELLCASNERLSETVGTAARMLYSPSAIERVSRTLARFRPHVVHIHNPYPALGPSLHMAARRQGVPIVMTAHNFRLRCPNGLMFTNGALCRRCERGMYVNALIHDCMSSRKQAAAYAAALWAHRFVLRLEQNVSLFVAPSGFMRQRLLDWGIPADRVVVIRNFVKPTPDASAEPGRYGLYIGRLGEGKGLDILLHALSRSGDPYFKIAGTGPLRSGLEELARELALRNCSFTGWQEPGESARLLKGARFVTIPSVWEENAPLAALEAMAAGRPLVLSDAGGLPELADTGAGLLSRMGDADELATSISMLVSDDRACVRLGGAGLAASRGAFSPSAHVSMLTAAYRRAIAH
jgi:glycosyltransferase involved in cell wall biosynthesis